MEFAHEEFLSSTKLHGRSATAVWTRDSCLPDLPCHMRRLGVNIFLNCVARAPSRLRSGPKCAWGCGGSARGLADGMLKAEAAARRTQEGGIVGAPRVVLQPAASPEAQRAALKPVSWGQVLVRPFLAANVGSVCRAMLNFGLWSARIRSRGPVLGAKNSARPVGTATQSPVVHRDLQLVAPECDHLSAEAVTTACGAERLLHTASVHTTATSP